MTVTPQSLAADGWAVATIGRRIGARCLDGVIGTVLTVAIYAALIAGLLNGSGALLGVALLLFLGYGFISFYFVLAKSATLGQLLLGLQNLEVTTGRPNGGRAFLKYLVMGLAAQFTAGIALLLALFFREQPLNRTWFDRIAGTFVGHRTGAPRPVPEAASLAPAAHPAEPVAVLGPPPSSPPPAAPVTPTVERPAPAPAWALPPVPAPEPTRTPSLLLDHGAVLPLDRRYVLGRDPSVPAGAGKAQVVPVVDPERSLSKTHLLVEADQDGVWVTDLHSTNGVSIADPGGPVSRAVPGTRTRVAVGGTITYGRRTMQVTA